MKIQYGKSNHLESISTVLFLDLLSFPGFPFFPFYPAYHQFDQLGVSTQW